MPGEATGGMGDQAPAGGPGLGVGGTGYGDGLGAANGVGGGWTAARVGGRNLANSVDR